MSEEQASEACFSSWFQIDQDESCHSAYAIMKLEFTAYKKE
ncbi:hypothetical protein [Lacticaseibacillus rhamnosus]|jgi:hypothetical protein|nr:hypothetical protein [Lacticaseibacillus rhamnosus]